MTLEPNSGTVGSQVTVIGGRFRPGPVEIRWNADDGILLATAEGPQFSAPFTVPSVPSDVYMVVAVQFAPGTRVAAARMSAAFTVTSTSSTANAGAAPKYEGAFPASQGSEGTGSSGSTGAEGNTGGTGDPSGTHPAVDAGQTTAPAGAGTEQSAGSAARAAAGAQSTAAGTHQQQPAPEGASQPGQTNVAAPSDRESTPQSPISRVTQDLWSGFARERLANGDFAGAPTSPDKNASLAIGLGFAMFGVTLTGTLAFGVVVRARRRSTA